MKVDKTIQSRIDKIRKGDITIKTKPGVRVDIRQTRHEFLFGTAITNNLAENNERAMSPDNREMFLKILAENFNYAVHEDALKWYTCEKEANKVDYSLADRIWELCHERHIPMRGHCVFWGKDAHVMSWLLQLDNSRLHKAMKRRGTGVAEHYKERIGEFDLNNEMVHNDFFRRRFGYGIINEMACMVKAGNPDAVLYVNDYGILADYGFNREAYITQIKNFLDYGVPFQGIGCQGHSFFSPAELPLSAEHVQKSLDMLSGFNLPIKITECLFEANDENKQAEDLYRIFPVYFAHPQVEAIIMWGFWAGTHWRPYSALWKKDWKITPQGKAYQDLVFNQWWTKESGEAEQDGFFKTRGFYGDYEITVDGNTKIVSLSGKDKSVEIIF